MEAYAHTHDLLPHLHRELDELFPRAVATEEEVEGEDTSPCEYERRGESLGKAVPKTRSAPTATTTTTAATTAATTTTATTKTVDPGGKAKASRAADREQKKASGGGSDAQSSG